MRGSELARQCPAHPWYDGIVENGAQRGGEGLALEEGGHGPWRVRDDRAIEEALFRRAHGYDVEETVREESEKYGAKTRVTRYHIPGDVRAQIFWLRNRRPEKWRDKPESDRQQKGVIVLDDIP